MDKKIFYLFGILLLRTTISESRVIVPRGAQNFANSGNGEIPYSLNPLGSADKPAFSPEISNKPPTGDDFGVYEYDVRPFDYDYEVPGEADKKGVDGGPKVNPEKFPSDTDRTERPLKEIDEKDDGIINKNPDTNKLDDDEAYEPFDDDSKNHADEDDSKPVDDDDKSIPKDEDDIDKDTDENHAEDDSTKKEHDEEEDNKHAPEDETDRVPEEDKDNDGPKEDDESKEHKDNDEKSEDDEDEDDKSGHDEDKSEHDEDDKSGHDEDKSEHDEDEKLDEDENSEGHGKADEGDDKDIHATEDAEPFSGGSVFDTPLFNYDRVKNYFGLLDKALGHVFKETLEEAKLLNGTIANTTEEEVDIDGKKYVVQKSVIKSADNHSTVYIETLSTKPKEADTEEIKNTELKNVTNV